MPVFKSSLIESDAENVPPPVNVRARNAHHEKVPLFVLDIVEAEDTLDEVNSTKDEKSVPLIDKEFVIVVVVPLKKDTEFGVLILSVVIVSAAANANPPPELLALIVTVEYGPSPGAIVLTDEETAENTSTDELALKVRPVVVAKFQTVPVPDIVKVPFPRLIVLVPDPLPLNPVAALSVTLLLFALKSSVPVNAPQVMD